MAKYVVKAIKDGKGMYQWDSKAIRHPSECQKNKTEMKRRKKSNA